MWDELAQCLSSLTHYNQSGCAEVVGLSSRSPLGLLASALLLGTENTVIWSDLHRSEQRNTYTRHTHHTTLYPCGLPQHKSNSWFISSNDGIRVPSLLEGTTCFGTNAWREQEKTNSILKTHDLRLSLQ